MEDTSAQAAADLERVLEERRQIRNAYRKAQDELHARKDELSNVHSSAFEEIHEKVNETFEKAKKVGHIRELDRDAVV